MSSVVDRPASSNVAKAVEKILPTLFENARETEERRWIVDENMRLLEEAGVFEMSVPTEFGGTARPLAELVEVVDALSTACPSTGWTVGLWAGGTLTATRFPAKARREIFTHPSTRVSGVFSPTGKLEPGSGGYLLNGSWKFNTGCRGARWDGLMALLDQPEGPPVPKYVMVPTEELTLLDDWHAYGASGTGSSKTVASNVFVPEHRVMEAVDLLSGEGQGENGALPEFNYPVVAYAAAASLGFYTGTARGMLTAFMDRIQGRAITYTEWADQAQHPVTQMAVARAAANIEAADALVGNVVALLQKSADNGIPLSVAERAYARGIMGHVVGICRSVVSDLHSLSGASAIMYDVPIQRYFRDIEALALHGIMNCDVTAELYGRVLLGLDPGTNRL